MVAAAFLEPAYPGCPGKEIVLKRCSSFLVVRDKTVGSKCLKNETDLSPVYHKK